VCLPLRSSFTPVSMLPFPPHLFYYRRPSASSDPARIVSTFAYCCYNILIRKRKGSDKGLRPKVTERPGIDEEGESFFFLLGWDKGASEHKNDAFCVYFIPSFIIALRRQINDNPNSPFLYFSTCIRLKSTLRPQSPTVVYRYLFYWKNP
jgi:hypothetical protein